MIATNKKEFFELLDYELKRVGIEENADILADFEEHFADGAMRGIPEEQTAERLGDIKEIVRGYLNLESSRINSIMEREQERKKISLTKPGRSNPADLSLMDARSLANSDAVREFTPRHLSEEIYPNAGTFNSTNVQNAPNSQSILNTQSVPNSQSIQNAQSTSKPVQGAVNMAAQSSVQNAGQAPNSTPQAGQNSGNVNNSGSFNTFNKSFNNNLNNNLNNNINNGVPQPNNSFRENYSSDRKGVLPSQYKKVTGKKPSYKIIDFSNKSVKVNGAKLAREIVLDVLLWSWLLPLVVTLTVELFVWLTTSSFTNGIGAFTSGYFIVSRVFLAMGYFSASVLCALLGLSMIRPVVMLVKYVINRHIRVIFDM